MAADRILVISHGHPDLSLGGGEIAAHMQWRELRRLGIEAMFLARSSEPSGHAGTPFTTRSADGREVLFHAPPVDHFRHSQPQRQVVYEDFRALLDNFKPTAVHFHHYVHLGLELVREVRRYSSLVPIVMTLHDYLGMCNAQGQMLKTSGMLCRVAKPMDCHGCFPDRSPQDFFMRELFVKSFLGLVDQFICPSQFLRDRYVAWGLPAEKMLVLENGMKPMAANPNAIESAAPPPTRFVVLGQLSRLKGTPLLLDAVQALPEHLAETVRIEIYGSVQQQDEKLRDALSLAQESLSPLLRYSGPYFPEDVGHILDSAAWLIVPSIWWENSPLVIQEAFRARRPVICANIGGMAEKVTHGVNGLHFQVGSATDLARRIEEAATTPSLWGRLQAGIPRTFSIEETVARQLPLYRAAAARPKAAKPAAPRTTAAKG